MRKLPLIWLLLTLFSCRPDLEPPTWSSDVLFPLIESDLKIQNALDDSLLTTNPDGTMNFVYRESFLNFGLDSIYSLPDTSSEIRFELPLGAITVPPGQGLAGDTGTEQYTLNGIELQFASIRSGSLRLDYENTVTEAIVVTYRLPNATLNGQPLFVTQTVPPGTKSNPTTLSRTYDLSDYEFDFRGTNQDEFNIINSEFAAVVDPNGQTTTVTGGDYFSFLASFIDIKPKYGRGYFGQQTVDLGPAIDSLNIFNNIKRGNINLDRASVTFEILNNIGVDMEAQITRLTGINRGSGNRVDLDHELTQSAVNINRAQDINNGLPVKPGIYKQTLTENNSNITDFLGNIPDLVEYEIGVNLNPFGNASGGNDFVYENEGLSLFGEVKIPLSFNADSLVIVDTNDFELDRELEPQTNRIVGGKLWLHALNWYPFEVEIQVTLLDSTNRVLESIIAFPNTIPAAAPGVDGKVESPVLGRIPISLNAERIANLYKTSSIIVSATINAAGSTPIDLFDYYKINAKLIADLEYEVNYSN